MALDTRPRSTLKQTLSFKVNKILANSALPVVDSVLGPRDIFYTFIEAAYSH